MVVTQEVVQYFQGVAAQILVANRHEEVVLELLEDLEPGFGHQRAQFLTSSYHDQLHMFPLKGLEAISDYVVDQTVAHQYRVDVT